MSSTITDLPEFSDPPEVAEVLRDRTGHLIARAHFATRDYADEALAPLGLVIRQYVALRLLHAEGPISQQALGERIACDRTTMVEVVDALESRGLTKRERNPADRRAYALELTDEGRRVLAEAERRLLAAENVLFEPLSDDERKRLHGLLLRILRQ